MSNKKNSQLGMNFSTAQHKLRKAIMFSLIALQGLDTCFQCGEKITNVDDLSVEHKEPWLDSENPKEKFFDLNNIAFSHLSCNAKASRTWNKKYNSEEEARLAGLETSRQWKNKNRVYDPVERRERYKRLGS